MDIYEFGEVVSSEESAECHLRKIGILRTYESCPKCWSDHVSKVRKHSLLCSSCRKEWSNREGSILYRSKASCRNLVAMMYLFEQGHSALSCSRQVKLNVITVSRFFRMFRKGAASGRKGNPGTRAKRRKATTRNPAMAGLAGTRRARRKRTGHEAT